MKTYTIGKLFIILSIPLIFLTCNTFAEDSTIDQLHDKSAILVSQEQFNEAIRIFDQILEIDPNNVKALINRSAVLITIGENEKGISDTDRILTIDPDNIKAFSNKGNALANLGYYYDAIEIFEKAIKIDPNNQKLKDARNYLFQHIDLFEISTQDKYEIHVQAQVRTQQDELITVIEGVNGQYLPFEFTDEFLNKHPVIEIVKKNGKNYEMRQIIHKTDEQQIVGAHLGQIVKSNVKTFGHIQFNALCKEISGCINIFAERTPSILIDSGDYMVVQWTIYRLVE